MTIIFSDSQVINVVKNLEKKLVFFAQHNYNQKNIKNIGIPVYFSKMKWCINNARNKPSAIHGFDNSFGFALWNTQGNGWDEKLLEDENGNLLELKDSNEVLNVLHKLENDFKEKGYIVISSSKNKNKKGSGNNNKGWGKTKLANMKWESIKDLTTKMLYGSGKTFIDLPLCDRNSIREKTIMQNADLITKIDLYFYLKSLGHVM